MHTETKQQGDWLERLRAALEAVPEDLVCAYLFGSRARGTARADSDLDVAVLFERDPPRDIFGLHTDLALRLGEAAGLPVDLVVLNRASPDLAHRVLRDGILLLERSRSRRIAFEVRSRNQYFDLLPHLRRYREGPAHDGR
jgi:predicted nucleotidyltransferase